MTDITYTLTNRDGEVALSVFGPDFEKVLTPSHPFYPSLVEYLTGNTEHDVEKVRRQVDPALYVGEMLAEINPALTYDMHNIYFEGIKVGGALVNFIKQKIAANDNDWSRFARFLVLLESNPSKRAKDAIWDWTQKHGVSIAEDGRMIGYKGLVDGEDALTGEKHVPVSYHAGPNNFVDGVLYGDTGVSYQVPHRLGAVISKRRSDVDDNSKLACSTGLHVGAYSYAKTFGENRADGARYSTMGRMADSLPNSTFALVAFSPADVVSVPEDNTSDWKIRVCKYEVVEFLDEVKDVLKDQPSYDVKTPAPFLPQGQSLTEEPDAVVEVPEKPAFIEPKTEEQEVAQVVPSNVRWWEIVSTDNLGETIHETISGTEEDALEVLEGYDPEGEFGYDYREAAAPGEDEVEEFDISPKDVVSVPKPSTSLDVVPRSDLVEPTKGTGLLGKVVLRDWADANPVLKNALTDKSGGKFVLGNTQVAKIFQDITTESSVRRYRKDV